MSLLALVEAVTITTAATLGPLAIQAIVGTLIPVATGLVTKSAAGPSVKQAVTAFLAAVSGLITASVAETGVAVISVETALLAFLAWIVAVATYNGVYSAQHLNDRLAPNRGLGEVVDARSFEKG